MKMKLPYNKMVTKSSEKIKLFEQILFLSANQTVSYESNKPTSTCFKAKQFCLTYLFKVNILITITALHTTTTASDHCLTTLTDFIH